MKAFLLFAVSLFLSGCVSPPVPVVYSEADWKYSAELPAKPRTRTKVTDTPVGTMTEHYAGTEIDKEVIMMTHVIFPITATPARLQAGYDGFVRGLLRTTPGKVVHQSDIRLGGLPAKRYVIDHPRIGRRGDYRVRIAGNEMHGFSYERPAERNDSETSKRFFASISRTANPPSPGDS